MHVFGLNDLDDKKNSWCAPGDCTGKVFVKIRELTSDPQDTSKLTYDDAEDFLRFLDKYVSRAVGNHTFARWKKSHQTKTLLDKISASDIAYTILVYENSREVWEEELFIKASAKTDEERKNAKRRHNPRYHKGRGKRLKRYGDILTEEGRKYYQELLMTFQDLKSSVFWEESLQVIGTNTRSSIMVKQESITTTQNQTSMRMKMNLKKTGRSKLKNLTVTSTQVT